jgi:hypothetical protein
MNLFYHKTMHQIPLLVMIMLLHTHPVWSDMVIFKGGGHLEGNVIQQGNQVHIKTDCGTVVVNRENVLEIQTQTHLEELFLQSLDKASNSADDCLKLARWAYDKQMNEQYVTALRKAVEIDPRHSTAREMLSNYIYSLVEIPVDQDVSEEFRTEMGRGFAIYRTDHFRICYNCTDVYAEICGELMERVYHSFIRFFMDRGFEPVPLQDRLEVVLFDSRDQFQRYTRWQFSEMTMSSGFYSTETDRSYYYDSLNDGKFQGYKRELAQQEEYVARMREEVTSNRRGSTRYTVTDSDGTKREMRRDGLLKELSRQEEKLEQQNEMLRNMYRNLNISITVHETTHQLAYSLGIHSHYCENPLWLVEGLAMFFEAPQQGQWYGPGRIHQDRLESFLTSCEPGGNGITLTELITNDRTFALADSVSKTAYAHAWSLFYYLVQEQHENLFDYIYDLSRRKQNRSYEPADRVADFEKYFGELASVEYRWEKTMKALQP